MRRCLIVALPMLGLSLATQPAVQAQGSLDLSSSMTAQCVGSIGSSCAQVLFTLNVAGVNYVDIFRLYSSDVTLWQFGSLTDVVDGTGTSQSFSGGVLTDGSELAASSTPWTYPGPLEILVSMATFSNPQNLSTGYLSYSANGTNPSTDQLWSTSGTVTPEPSTFVLLATGLVGLFGFARKRKRGVVVHKSAEAC